MQYLGSSTVLTAHNLFVRLNSNRAYIGEGILTDAPSLDVEIPTAPLQYLYNHCPL